MITSIILINAERTRINDVAEQLADNSNISEVYSVSGNYDLIAIVRVKSNDELSANQPPHPDPQWPEDARRHAQQ